MTIHDDARHAGEAVYDAAIASALASGAAEVAALTAQVASLTTDLDLANAAVAAANATLTETQAELDDTNGQLSETLAALDSTTIALADATAYGQEQYAAAVQWGAAWQEAKAIADYLDAENTRLRALVVQLGGDPDPAPEPEPDPEPEPQPVAPTVFGASDGVWPINGVTDLDGHRAYLGGGDLNANTSWTTTGELKNAVARTRAGDTIWLSIKDNRPSDLARLLANKPADRNIVVTYRHEPENDVKLSLSDPAKQADIAAYQSAWAQLLPVIRNGGAKSATCLLGDRVSPMVPNNPESVAYHVKGVDYVGFDRYNPGLGDATSYTNPTTVLQGVVQYALNRSAEDGADYALAIGEWGTIAVGSSKPDGVGGDQAGRRTWAAGYVARIKAIHADPTLPDVPVCLYWNSSRMAFNTDPAGTLAQIALNRA